MKLFNKEMALLLVFIVSLSSILISPAAQAVSASSSLILLYVDKKDAFINKNQIELESPATIIKDKMFVPAKFLGDAMGFNVQWNEATRTIQMTPPGYLISMDIDHKIITINGIDTSFDSVAAIVNGKLLVKLTWVADYMGAHYTYNDELRRVDIMYTPYPKGIYVDKDSNSSPVAKFMVTKPTYRLGEPVKFVDLSYDPDAEGLVSYTWTGKQEAYFVPGTYPVTLQVSDSHGHISQTFTSNVTVVNEPYLNEVEFPIYMKPVGGFIKTNWSILWSHFNELPQLPKTVKQNADRKLLLSDSPEEFTQKGILYQDIINDKARLYADHINGTQQKMTMAILATNNSDKPVTLRTTNKGEVWPSVYANLIGSEASVDFLLGNTYQEKLEIPAHQTLIYSQLPDFYPGQGVNLFYDIESDGELQMSFVAAETITQTSLSELPKLEYTGHVRGSFPVSELDWKVEASTFKSPSIVSIGDNTTDPFVKGYDVFRKQETENGGNYGVLYKIHMDKPRKMTVMMLPLGGVFKGPFKVNGEIVPVPASGVITAFDGMVVLARTSGTEESLDIEFTPPAGSAFPINLIFYPLDDKK